VTHALTFIEYRSTAGVLVILNSSEIKSFHVREKDEGCWTLACYTSNSSERVLGEYESKETAEKAAVSLAGAIGMVLPVRNLKS